MRKARAVTLSLPDPDRPYLVLVGKRYLLRNISHEGIGLWLPKPTPVELHEGSQLQAEIFVREKSYPVSLEVVHESGNLVGLKFRSVPDAVRSLFEKMLEPASEAVRLEPHPLSDEIDPSNNFRRLFYLTPSGSELSVWYNEMHRLVMALQICWFGRWVMRRQLQPAKTGVLKELPRAKMGELVASSELLFSHDEADDEVMNEAARFLTAVNPPLPGARLWQFLVHGEQVFLPKDPPSRKKVA